MTEGEAALWTDGRYFLQAEQQLDSNWKLMRAGLPNTPSKEAYLTTLLKAGDRVGVDPQTISWEAATKLRESLEASKLQLSLIEENLVDAIWEGRPARTLQPIYHLPEEYSGRSLADKIKCIRDHLESTKMWGFLVTALDDIACREASYCPRQPLLLTMSFRAV